MSQTDWIPVIPSSLVNVSDVIQVFIKALDLVVWRSTQGRLQIWQNRCPHRSVRLSLGHVQGENLVCAYHGWQFSAENSSCQIIPSQPLQRAPSSICTTTYACKEQNGMIWVNLNQVQTDTKIISSLEMTQAYTFLGSVNIPLDRHTLHHILLESGFTQVDTWQYQHHDQSWGNVTVFISPHQNSCSLYAISSDATTHDLTYIKQLRQLRDHIMERETCSM